MSADPFIPLDAGDHPPRGGAAHAHLVAATRALIDAVAAAAVPEDVAHAAMADIGRATRTLEPYGVSRVEAPAGNRADLPGEGHPAMAPSMIDHWSARDVRGRVVFTRAHDGGRGAVHGGWLSLVYDDVLGRLAGRARPQSRTAFLHVDYRAVTPVGVELTIEGRIDRIEGRKIFVSGAMRRGDRVLTEARALFLVLRVGQP
jgi:acyl-coenzyme A thioesterase PaaI-like protein